jgi:hypothetical protein
MVPCLALWLNQKKPVSVWQSWREVLWLLLLFIAFYASVVLSLAGLEWQPRQHRYIIVLDNSASMGVMEKKGTRWQQACRVVEEYRTRGEVLLFVTSPSPHRPDPTSLYAHASLWHDEGDILSRIAVDAGSGAPERTVTLALNMAAPEEAVVIISDGAGAVWQELLGKLAGMDVPPRLHVIGEARNNVSLTVTEAYRTPDGQVELGIAICNHGKDTRHDSLVWQYRPLSGETQEQHAIPYDIPAGATFYQRLSLPAQGGNWQASLASDVLLSDNRAVCVIPAFRQARVLVMSEQSLPHLIAALSAYPYLIDRNRSSFSDSDELPANSGDYDLIIVCRPTLATLGSSGNFLLWGTSLGDLLLHPGVRTRAGAIWGVAARHPLSPDLELSGLKVKESWQSPILSPEQTVVYGEEGAIVWTCESGEFRYIYVAFAWDDSNWYWLPSFPVFIHNSILWATRQELSLTLPVVQAEVGESDIAPFVGPYPSTPDRFARGIPIALRPWLLALACLLWAVLLWMHKSK